MVQRNIEDLWIKPYELLTVVQTDTIILVIAIYFYFYFKLPDVLFTLQFYIWWLHVYFQVVSSPYTFLKAER